MAQCPYHNLNELPLDIHLQFLNNTRHKNRIPLRINWSNQTKLCNIPDKIATS
eukprot:UN09737